MPNSLRCFNYLNASNNSILRGNRHLAGVAFGDWCGGDCIENREARLIGCSTENSVVGWQRVIFVNYEKLATISVWSRVGHGNCSARIFAAKLLVGKFVTRPAHSISKRIAALNHKSFNYPVKFCPVVK